MVNIDSRDGLSIAEIAFYVPALFLSLAVCSKQGFTRNAGWLYLCLISVLRLIGSSVELYITTQNDYDQTLIETAAITGAIGLSPLLLALMGILQRLHAQMSGAGFSPNVFRPIHLVGIGALVLGIIGGTDSADPTSTNYDTGRTLSKAASLLFFAIYLALGGIALLTATTKASHIPASEKKILIASVSVLPFILVRVAYSIASAFGSPGSLFYFQSPNVWVEAFMMFAMEAIVVSLYIWAGLLSPKSASMADDGHNVEAYGMKPNAAEGAYRQQPGVSQEWPAKRHEEQYRGNQQQRSIGDYRPSRMIRNAIQNRG